MHGSHLCMKLPFYAVCDLATLEGKISYMNFLWWWGEDLNLRRLCRQIYSLIPLTAREPHHFLCTGADTPNRTEDILITSEMLYQLSYIGLPCRKTNPFHDKTGE